ncbi:MAG: phosphorylcholine transferase LicD [Candidatus Saccharimonadales bacterium]
MTDLQHRIFKIYEAFKKVCDDNNLRYYAEGGTKIGATYWSGFIPWDDDMDIVMPLPDYEKFLSLCADQLPAPLELFNGIEQPHTDLLFSKVHDRTTMFTMDNNLPFPESYIGVFLDINPLIGMPEDEAERQAFSQEFISVARKICYAKLYDAPGDIPELTRTIMQLMHKYDYETSKFVQPLNSLKNRQLFLREDMENSTPVAFETSTIYNPNNAAKQIDIQYDNFKKDLEPSERTGHNGFVDLENSCKYYAEKFAAEPLTLAAFNRYNHHIHQLRTQARR